MNAVAAIISGIAGTLAMSMLMSLAPKMGLPNMDIVGMLGSVFGKPNRILGWALHMMMGAVFALIYANLWALGLGAPNLGIALVFGSIHWILVGMAMAMVPVMHVGIRNGTIAAPGLWMINQGGLMSFAGGLAGHWVYAAVMVLVYNLI